MANKKGIELSINFVVIMILSGELYPGKEGTFTVGIRNTEDATQFSVNIIAVAGADRNGAGLGTLTGFEFTHENQFELQKNDDKNFGLIIKAPTNAVRGAEYAINVKVCSASSTVSADECSSASSSSGIFYGLQKIYITIPS